MQEEQNITAGIVAIDYFESIENPSIALIITFIDTDQLIGRLGVTGGEYLNLSELSGEEDDELYDEAVNFVLESRRASISAVQRKLRIGYNRAARIIESMEAAGLVSEMSSNGSREVLVPKRN